jgi:hypothetical protein
MPRISLSPLSPGRQAPLGRSANPVATWQPSPVLPALGRSKADASCLARYLWADTELECGGVTSAWVERDPNGLAPERPGPVTRLGLRMIGVGSDLTRRPGCKQPGPRPRPCGSGYPAVFSATSTHLAGPRRPTRPNAQMIHQSCDASGHPRADQPVSAPASATSGFPPVTRRTMASSSGSGAVLGGASCSLKPTS